VRDIIYKNQDQPFAVTCASGYKPTTERELVVDWYNSIQIADHYAFSETARISELVEGRRAHQREH